MVAQLKDIPAHELHKWDKYCNKYNMYELGYVYPIVDYSVERKRSVQQYRDVL